MPEDAGIGGARWIVVVLAAAGVVSVLFTVTGVFDSLVPGVLGVVLWASAAVVMHCAGKRPSRPQESYRAEPRTALERWGPPVVLTVVVGVVFWQGIVPKIRSLGADGSVLSWTVPYDESRRGSEIDLALAGELDVPESLQLVAMCRNGTDWMSDTTLRTAIVVGTKPALVRAAQLVTDGSFDGGLVRRVEQRAMAGNTDDEIVAALGEDWGADEVERYLAARVEAPSKAATERFVAYAAAVNGFGDGLVRVVDREALDAGAIGSFADQFVGAEIRLAGVEGARQVRAGACAGVADRSG